jgi:hypothetical protein
MIDIILNYTLTPFKQYDMCTRGEIAAMLAKVVVVGVRGIVARGAQDLTNYSILYFS